MRTTKFYLLPLALAVLLIGLAAPSLAQPASNPNVPETAGPPQDVVDMLLEQGFERLQPSIFERPTDVDGSSFENVVFGIEGHEWLLSQQQAFLQTLQARYELYPDGELLDAVLAQEARIADTQALLEEMRSLESGSGASAQSGTNGLTAVRVTSPGASSGQPISLVDALQNCTTSFNRRADAVPQTSGPLATAASSFSDNCAQTGTVSATASAQGTDSSGNVNTFTQDCPSKTGSSVSCNVSASVNAVTECFYNGQSTVTIGFTTYTVSEFNDVCTKVLASIDSGPFTVYVPYGSKAWATWNGSATGGQTPYGYQWLYNNASVDTDTSYTRAYLHPGYGTTVYDSLKFKVTDASGQTSTASRTIKVVYESSSSTCDPNKELCPIETELQ